MVKERQDAMLRLSDAIKSLNELVKQDQPALGEIVVQAEVIRELSGERLLALFPAAADNPMSQASPRIWERWMRFERLAQDLEESATTLSQASQPTLLKNALTLTGATCSSCHKHFRLKQN